MDDSIIKECDVCKQTVLELAGPDNRVYAWDFPSGDKHDCFDIPDGVEFYSIGK